MDFTQEHLANQDLSTQKKLDQTLLELADIKRALDVSTIVAITDTKGVITYVNDA